MASSETKQCKLFFIFQRWLVSYKRISNSLGCDIMIIILQWLFQVVEIDDWQKFWQKAKYRAEITSNEK